MQAGEGQVEISQEVAVGVGAAGQPRPSALQVALTSFGGRLPRRQHSLSATLQRRRRLRLT